MIDIPILYEDADVLALNKPAGIAVHKDGYDDSAHTVADWLLERYPGLREVGEPAIAQNGEQVEKPGIVHRLDKDTTGVLLVAKTEPAYKYLKRQFQDHEIRKVYRLIVSGNFSEGKLEGTINLPIGRSRKDPRIRVASRKAASVLREAVTHYRVLEQYPGYDYIEAHPQTGRTHQLRAHFKALSHPLVCDALYAPGEACLPGLERQALHALNLEFNLPSQSDGVGAKKRLKIEAPLPADFQAALDYLKGI